MNSSPNSEEPWMSFRRVKAIMSDPVRPPEAYNDSEIEAIRCQEPITDFPNEIYQLPAFEFPSDDNNENPNQLHLNNI